MEELLAAEREKQIKKNPIQKKLLIVGLAIGLLFLTGTVGFLVLAPKAILQPDPNPEGPKVEVPKDVYLQAKSVKVYKLQIPQINSGIAFVNNNPQSKIFLPSTAYFLSSSNKLYGQPVSLLATNPTGNPWCYLNQGYSFHFSANFSSVFCLENIDNKNVVLRWINLNGGEFKELMFEGSNDIFKNEKIARVISSRDGDSTLLYSSAGVYVVESLSASIFAVDMPNNLEFRKIVHISNTEIALVTADNLIYRINFSSHRGGIFNVNNFGGIDESKLTPGLETLRLSKDGKRLVFVITGQIDTLPFDRSLNLQNVIAYNIDLNNGKVLDELNYEDRFLVTCKYPLGSRYCLYKFKDTFPREGKLGDEDVVLIKEFDAEAKVAFRSLLVRSGDSDKRIDIEVISENPNYFFIKVPYILDPKKNYEISYVVYAYNTKNESVSPIN